MEIAILSVLYLWVLLIHSFFVGISFYNLMGKKLIKWSSWKVILLMMVPLIFFEFYWIPFFNMLELEIFTKNTVIQQYFGFDSETNIVDLIGLSWMHFFFFPFAGFVSFKIGKWSYSR